MECHIIKKCMLIFLNLKSWNNYQYKPSISGTLNINIPFKLCSGIKKIQLKHDRVSKINK